MLTKWILSRPALLTFCCLLQACGGGSDATPPVPPPVEFKLSAVAGAGGKISPASLQVSSGQTGSFTVSPDEGYEVAAVTGCNGTLNGTQYITAAAVSACSINAEFRRKSYQILLTIPTQPAETFNVSHGDRLNIDIRIQDQALTLDKAEGCAGELKPVGDSGRTYTFLIAAVTQGCELKVSTKQRPILININLRRSKSIHSIANKASTGRREHSGGRVGSIATISPTNLPPPQTPTMQRILSFWERSAMAFPDLASLLHSCRALR